MPWMVGRIDFEKSHEVPPLPPEWKGIYLSYKSEAYRYEKALRLILAACESAASPRDVQKAVNYIEDLARVALEGGENAKEKD